MMSHRVTHDSPPVLAHLPEVPGLLKPGDGAMLPLEARQPAGVAGCHP